MSSRPPRSPAAAAASSDLKVVLVVGATHEATSSYRDDMDRVYETARQYSANVVKVYSPNATWTAVRTALQGASIVVYMGHGNGFPSPYLSTLWPDRQDGFGLNEVAGAGDSNTTYYGEKYISESINLAPNAVVILNHLCYASGNSEPGQPEPSLSVAKARIDNFAAGFLRAGARAVIADAHSDASWYIDQLFTTHQTLDQVFRTKPWAAGNTFTFASSRTPGYTAYSDPGEASPPASFYRSMVARLTLTTDNVTGAPFAGPVGDPGVLTVPGMAEVTGDGGIGLYPDPSLAPDPAPAFLPDGTRLRIEASMSTPAGGLAYQVTTVDGMRSGFVGPAGLTSLVVDGTPPGLALTGVRSAPIVLSPNADGLNETGRVSFVLSEPASIVASVRDAAGTVVRTFSVSAPAGAGGLTWDGLGADGVRVADGQYLIEVTAQDATGNISPAVVAPVAIATARSRMTATPAWISPAGNSADPRVSSLSFTLARPATVMWQVTTSAGAPVRTWYAGTPMDAGVHVVAWDGRSDTGALAPKGRYLSQVTVDDGITSTTEQIWVYSGGIRIAMSDTTPAAGQAVTITAVAVEALGASPFAWITQPGRARIGYRMTKVGTATYRVRLWFKAGPAGAVTVRIAGVDRFGRSASATVRYRLH